MAFALVDPSFLALDFFAAASGLLLPLFTELDQLFLSAEDCRFAKAFCLALGFADDSFRGFFSCRLSSLLATHLGVSAELSADYKKNRTGNNKQKYASCG